jgi:hypothetical protein
MQDNDGNTALHLAVKLGFQDIFCLLLENLQVNLNITNNNGETPLDLSDSNICDGSFCSWVSIFIFIVHIELSLFQAGLPPSKAG